MFTSDHALKMEWLPNWIAIIGSGYIGLEFSDVYTALGCEVGVGVWALRVPLGALLTRLQGGGGLCCCTGAGRLRFLQLPVPA